MAQDIETAAKCVERSHSHEVTQQRTSIDIALLADLLPGAVRIHDVVWCSAGMPCRSAAASCRFREDNGYNGSFALQWSRFKTNQIDAVNGTQLSLRRFAETGWAPADLAGKLVLEAGCGAGRFTRILSEAGARLVAFDYSAAVDACRENNGLSPTSRSFNATSSTCRFGLMASTMCSATASCSTRRIPRPPSWR